MQRNVLDIRIVRLLVVYEIGSQLVLDLGVVLRRLEGPRDVFRQLHRKGVGILARLDGSSILFQHVFDCIEIFASSVFLPVFGAALEPLAPLVT